MFGKTEQLKEAGRRRPPPYLYDCLGTHCHIPCFNKKPTDEAGFYETRIMARIVQKEPLRA